MSLVVDEMDANPILRLTRQVALLHVPFFPSVIVWWVGLLDVGRKEEEE
jgi:hypothetical protein